MKPYIQNRIDSATKKMLGAFGVASELFAEDINWRTAGRPPTGFLATFADAETGSVLHREILGTIEASQEPLIDRASEENIRRLSGRFAFEEGWMSSTQFGNGLAHYGTIRVNYMPEPMIVSVGGLAGPFDHVFACIGGIWIADDEQGFQDEVVPKLMGDNAYWKQLNDHEAE